MNKPAILSGKLHLDNGCLLGKNVTIDVAEEVIIGARSVIPDNAYLGGRRIEIGADFYGYAHDNRCLDVGRGRRDEEDAVLRVGARCTFHDNRIDLSRRVSIGDDVGLSPEVVIYTHGYWQSVLDGYPARFAPVTIGNNTIVGFRSVLLPGSSVGEGCVIGAGSVVSGELRPRGIYGGVPAKLIREVTPPAPGERRGVILGVLAEYLKHCAYRGFLFSCLPDLPVIRYRGCAFDVEKTTVVGDEDEYTDDLRDFLFRRGIRFYTQRPFRRLQGAWQGGKWIQTR